MRYLAASLILLALASLGCTKNNTPSPPNSATNTGVNARDKDTTGKDPISGQDENSSDVKITAEIRRKIIAGKFSFDARNVKILTSKGVVTLRGPVDTVSEKDRIVAFAKEVAGDANVVNEIDVVNAPVPATTPPADKVLPVDPKDAPMILPPAKPEVPTINPPVPAPVQPTEPEMKPTVKSL